MSRLSVSLEPEQAEWIETKKEELGVSKGKIIRECVNEVRTGESLFTGSPPPIRSSKEDRIAALEDRLASLEQTLEDVTVSKSPSQQTRPTASVSSDANPTASQKTHETMNSSDKDSQNLESGDEDAAAPTDLQSSAHSTPDESLTQNEDSEQSPGRDSDSPDSLSSSEDDLKDTSDGTSRAHYEEAKSSPNSESINQGPTEVTESPVPEQSNQSLSDEEQTDSPVTITADAADKDEIERQLKRELDDENRAEVLMGIWNQLHERGTLHIKSIKTLHEEVPLEYESEDEWWEEGIRPVIDELAGVEPPKGGGNLYRFKY